MKSKDLKQKRKMFKRLQAEAQALVGGPDLVWEECAVHHGRSKGRRAVLTKEQAQKMKEEKNDSN